MATLQNSGYRTRRYKNIEVSYLPGLDGGGTVFGQQYVRVVQEKIGKVDHIFEFCAGPGFIGFSLLAHGLCNRLTLADINPEAVRACQYTIATNHLQDRATVYLSDCLDSIPATEQWDLVISNPPHWPGTHEKYAANILKYDPDMSIHRRFYRDVCRFLKPRGTILIQENGQATKYSDFVEMIEASGLRIVEVFHARVMSPEECQQADGNPELDTRISPFYFVWSVRSSSCLAQPAPGGG